ncbi:MAG: hypothetical protein J7J57_02465 [Caldisericaceae bacterium]|nr:hypothetical protein [Caldisericaceae bacterium]
MGGFSTDNFYGKKSLFFHLALTLPAKKISGISTASTRLGAGWLGMGIRCNCSYEQIKREVVCRRRKFTTNIDASIVSPN